MRRAPRAAIPLVALAALFACGGRGCGSADDGQQVVVYTSVDQVFSEPIFNHCQRALGLRVRALFDTEETKSTGILNRLLAEARHPQADVFWSGDPVRPFTLIERGQVAPHRSKVAAGLPAAFRGQDGSWAGLAARARVLLVNTDRVPPRETPRSIHDLAAGRWRGQAALANPLYGTTTMHVAALFAAWGDRRAREFMASLRDNQVRIASSNGEVKRLVVAGEVAIGLTDTDDAHQALRAGAPVKIVYPDQGQDQLGTLLMPTAVVRIKGGPHPPQGRRLMDCLLGAEVERKMAAAAAHMPLRAGVPTPAGVPRAGSIKAMQVDYRVVARTMNRIQPWMRRWVGL